MDSNDVWSGWGSVILAACAVVAFMTMLTVVLWQVFRTWQARLDARVTLARDEDYKALAEQSTTAQKRMASEQERLSADLGEIRNRIASIEKMLAEVG
jgi:hypothetical protein